MQGNTSRGIHAGQYIDVQDKLFYVVNAYLLRITEQIWSLAMVSTVVYGCEHEFGGIILPQHKL